MLHQHFCPYIETNRQWFEMHAQGKLPVTLYIYELAGILVFQGQFGYADASQYSTSACLEYLAGTPPASPPT